MAKHTEHYILYHKDCADGMAAAWAFDYLFKDFQSQPEYAQEGDTDELKYYPVQYNNPHPFVSFDHVGRDDRRCYILDFSYSRGELIDLAQVFSKVLVLDHHKTAQEALSNWEDKPANVEIVFDMNRSGAGITWDHFSEGLNYERPRLVNYVEDRDLWRFDLPKSKEINMYIATIPKTLKDYNILAEKLKWEFGQTVEIGEVLIRYFEKLCTDIVANAQPICLYDDEGVAYRGLVANCTGHFASDVGNLLAQQSGTYGATWYTEANGKVKFSLRSIGDYDVTKITKAFKGGGHKNAAGFSLNNPAKGDGEVMVWSKIGVNLPQGGM